MQYLTSSQVLHFRLERALRKVPRGFSNLAGVANEGVTKMADRSKPDVSPPPDKKSKRAQAIVTTLVVVERVVKFGRWLDEHLGISDWLASL
jgi:hypothetical protein